MRFWSGLLLGAVLGAAATWLALERPWRSSAPAPVAIADAGPPTQPARPGKRSRRGRRGGGGGGPSAAAPGSEVEVDAPPPVLSAADRAMTWRGPTITPPSRSVDLGAEGGARPLSNDEIDAVVQRSSGAVVGCIERSLAGAELRGVVKLQLLVDGNGGVRTVRVGAPAWLHDHGFTACATAAARRFRFPATGASTVVDAPYHLDDG